MFRISFLAIFCGLLVAGSPWVRAAKAPPVPDTRILIDISGSMKKNDPKNLRRPALRLLVGLLPTDSRAGIWTFGQYVNMQVPLGKVDERWRGKARKGAGKIHSRGLFTHIESAIAQASADWSGPAGKYQRHLVLLTDGMVDVSKDQAESDQSRTHILERQLPKLKELGVQVHTVALSARADHELMRALSQTSSGWYEQVESAARLQKVFLRIFEKVGNPDTVPLKDNRFKVDKSIREVTLIVFRAEGAAPTRVTMPSGESFDESAPPDNVSWHQDEGYDLLTIKDPMAGDWKIQAQVDPDNRVMILTDLRMQVSETPNHIVAGQRIPMDVSFFDQGEIVSRREFVEMVHLSAEQIGPDGTETEPRPLRDDGQGDDPLAFDGKFELRFDPQGEWGRGELLILAEGKTFQREKRRIFELVLPAEAALVPDDTSEALKLNVLADPQVIEDASMEATAELTLADGSHQSLVLNKQGDGYYQGMIQPAELVGEAKLTIRIRARTLGGDPVGAVLPLMSVKGLQEPPAPEQPQAVTPQGSALEEVGSEEDESSLMMIGFGIANAVLVLVGGLAFWLLRRRRKKDFFELVDEEEERGDAPPAQQAKEAAA